MSMGMPRMMGVMISESQKRAGEETQDTSKRYEPGTLVNLTRLDTYVIELVDGEGTPKHMTVHVAGDAIVFAHPTSENWTRELKQLTKPVQEKIISRIKTAREALVAGQTVKSMVSIPVAKKAEETKE